ncbi:MAG: winged helix-turn-helix domain-containing protein [Nitrososphaerales archaeon]
MDQKRGVFDIVGNLLEHLEAGAYAKTALASKANLSTRSSSKYISLILRVKLAVRDESTNLYKLTDKGRKFLEEYRKLRMLIEE